MAKRKKTAENIRVAAEMVRQIVTGECPRNVVGVLADLLEEGGRKADADTLRRYATNTPPEDAVREARRVVEQDYWSDVRGVAEDVRQELESSNCYGETARQWLLEAVQGAIDGHGRVIYTHQAIECLCVSDNHDAYVDEYDFDGENMVEGGTVRWSVLAYCAMERDVMEHLEALGIDVNDPRPEPEEEDAEEETAGAD